MGLRDFVILDPQWLTDVMATVISTKTRALDQGILHHDYLRMQIWKGEEYPPYLHDTLLLLLEKFHIAFRLKRRRTVLRAVEDVQGATANKLSFKKGDKILLLDRHATWWRGLCNGNVWYFRSDQVREAADEPPEYMLKAESLIPCALSEKVPNTVSAVWPDAELIRKGICGRRWSFDFLPIPFFSMFIVRMLHFADARIYWRYGILVEKLSAKALI